MDLPAESAQHLAGLQRRPEWSVRDAEMWQRRTMWGRFDLPACVLAWMSLRQPDWEDARAPCRARMFPTTIHLGWPLHGRDLSIRRLRPSSPRSVASIRSIEMERDGGSWRLGGCGAYRGTRCKTTGRLGGRWKDRFIEGSDPFGGGPTAGCGPVGVSTCGIRKGNSTFRWSSMRSSLTVPA